MTKECIEVNWLCKHIKKIRSSQAAILWTDSSKTQLFPVRIVKVNNQNTRASVDVTLISSKVANRGVL